MQTCREFFCDEVMKLTISRKLLLGYLLMALLTVVASAYALASLQRLSSVAYNITNNHISVMERSKKMLDILMAQERAEKKYLILKDPEIEQIFWHRSDEFLEEMELMRRLVLDERTKASVTAVAALQNSLKKSFAEEVQLIHSGRFDEAGAISETRGRTLIQEMSSYLLNVQKNADETINNEMNLIASQGLTAVHLTLGIGLLSLVLGITLALIITRNISRPLQQLQKAAGMIAEGNLDQKIEARRDDEIGALAKSFDHMTQRLKVLEELNLDASPLTGLPGNLAIESRIAGLLSKGEIFSLCQVDLDNFKPFADKYGYAWGSEVIKEVAVLLAGYISGVKPQETFLGHIGGDDFVVIGRPDQVESICQRLVADFEPRIHSFYEEQDAQNGYFIGRNRQGIVQKLPLITVTAAIVTDDGSRFRSPLEMARKVAQLKEYAKSLPGSNYVHERDLPDEEVLQLEDLQALAEADNAQRK